MPDKSSRFLSSEQPSEPKSLDVALNIAGVEKICWENLRLRSTWRPFNWSFEQKGALVTVEIYVFCGRWFSNQFEIVSETPFNCDTVSCELYIARCCALKWTETFGSESMVMCFFYLILRSGVFMFGIPNVNYCQ